MVILPSELERVVAEQQARQRRLQEETARTGQPPFDPILEAERVSYGRSTKGSEHASETQA
jgi:hypothetical protein